MILQTEGGRRLLFRLTLGAVLLALVGLVVAAAVGRDPLGSPLLWFSAALGVVAGLGALMLWARERRSAAAAVESDRRARQEAERRAAQLEEEVRDAAAHLAEERARAEADRRRLESDLAEERVRREESVAAAGRLESELQDVRGEQERLQRDLDQAHGALAATRAGLEETRTELERAAAEREEARRELGTTRGELQQSRTETEQTRAALDEARGEREEAVAARDQARTAADAMQRARQSEQRWISILRREIFELQRQRGTLGDPKDVPSLVLRISVGLVEASKGLLFSVRDDDADGHLDLVAWHGFDADPTGSAIAERFARIVMARDEIVREDQPHRDTDSRTQADAEIENLVAIPIYILDRFHGAVVCLNRQGGFADLDEEVLLALGGHAGALLQNARLHGRLRSAYIATVRVLADAMEAKDGSLRGHGDEVARYAGAVADRLGLDPKRREEVVFGSLLHDVGKIGISERILLKPAVLTPEEFAIVKLHPRIGHRLVQQVPDLDAISLGILHHHERWDGTGYPHGLKGEQIPQEARIICVADAFSAMTARRPYRQPRSYDEACEELKRHAARQFDPEIVEIFIDEVFRRPPGEEATGLVAVMADPELSARRVLDEPLLGHAEHTLTDSLTLLYSHRYFHDTLAAENRRADLQSAPYALLMAELQGLADLNRREGYAAGDAALQRAARVVEGVAARCNGSAYRYSGRRFAIIAPQMDDTAARDVAQQINEDRDAGVTMLATAAVWQPGETAEDVLRRALEALALVRPH